MKFSFPVIYVENVPETLEFYEQAFNLKASFLHEAKRYGEITMGDSKLAFVTSVRANSIHGMDFHKNTRDAIPSGLEIVIEVDNVQASYKQAVEAGAEPVKEPETQPWGQTVAWVRDCNGILIDISSS